ncbi:hypothetical protein RA210_U50211 [Rubrivivax sp. A210]|nr:hypothetical protein RA210_U50211 [Rubrivivax sp. A210]
MVALPFEVQLPRIPPKETARHEQIQDRPGRPGRRPDGRHQRPGSGLAGQAGDPAGAFPARRVH